MIFMSDQNCNCGGKKGGCHSAPEQQTRRSFLRTSAVLASGIAAIAASLAPLRELSDMTSVDEFLQKHYKEMTPKDMALALERIRGEVEKQYGLRPELRDLKPMDGV